MIRNIFIIALTILFSACSTNDKQHYETTAKKNLVYHAVTVKQTGVNSFVILPAQLAAYEEVSIFPKVNGYVKTVLVDIGSKVSKRQLLMVLEAPEMLQATMQAKEKYMESTATYAVSKEKYNRLQVAAQTEGAVSPFDLSSAKAKMEADSSLTNAEKTAWQMQQTTQDYLQVKAPFSGIITQRNVHPGALVNATDKNMPMLELKNMSHLRLQIDIPEDVSGNLNTKDSISFTTSAMPGKIMKAVISRKSMNIESKLRAERIEIDVNNADMKLSPGMYASVTMKTNGNSYGFTVPVTAVMTTTEGKFLFTTEGNNIYKRINVSAGNKSGDEIEVYGPLKNGQQVITNPDEDLVDETQ